MANLCARFKAEEFDGAGIVGRVNTAERGSENGTTEGFCFEDDPGCRSDAAV
jgi:hypothetical protein